MAVRFHSRCFTLLELMVVIAIMMMLTTVATVQLRSNRKTTQISSSLNDLRRFTAKVRFFAMTNQCDVVMKLYPEERVIKAESGNSALDRGAESRGDEVDSEEQSSYVILDVIEDYDESVEYQAKQNAPQMAEKDSVWRFPEKPKCDFLMDGVEQLMDDEGMELWRFDRSGRARLATPLVLDFAEQGIYSVSVKEFSGMTEIVSGDVREERLGD